MRIPFGELPVLEHGSVRAWSLEDVWPSSHSRPGDWTDAQVRTVRAALALPADELEAVTGVDPESDPDVRSELWSVPLPEILEASGLEPAVTKRRKLFDVGFEAGLSGAMAWSWGWTGLELTPRLGLLLAWGDSEIYGGWGTALGLFTKDERYRSAALVLAHYDGPVREPEDRFGEMEWFWENINRRVLSPKEVYRLLLAYQRRGIPDVFVRSADDISRIREPDMVKGFPEVLALLENRWDDA